MEGENWGEAEAASSRERDGWGGELSLVGGANGHGHALSLKETEQSITMTT